MGNSASDIIQGKEDQVRKIPLPGSGTEILIFLFSSQLTNFDYSKPNISLLLELNLNSEGESSL
jgi:hypothetical protein